MLVLTRKEGEKICIGDDVVITVVRSGGDKVRLGIDAPANRVILRSELKGKEQPTTRETISLLNTAPIAKCS
ncbi:MAG: carbon storage regulator [Planctomycetaceae bacterium]|jgi:carbon storage regulator|nr:carbon storage regulator [Planctomycetaceae bacterium]